MIYDLGAHNATRVIGNRRIPIGNTLFIMVPILRVRRLNSERNFFTPQALDYLIGRGPIKGIAAAAILRTSFSVSRHHLVV